MGGVGAEESAPASAVAAAWNPERRTQYPCHPGGGSTWAGRPPRRISGSLQVTWPRTRPFWPATGTILRTYVVLCCPEGVSDASVASPSPDSERVCEPAPT